VLCVCACACDLRVQPSNVLIDDGGRPFLTDFDLSSVDMRDGHATITRTATAACGTTRFFPPEAVPGLTGSYGYMDPILRKQKWDAWSLGCIILMVYTGPDPNNFSPETFATEERSKELVQTSRSKARASAGPVEAVVDALLTADLTRRSTVANVLKMPLFAGPPLSESAFACLLSTACPALVFSLSVCLWRCCAECDYWRRMRQVVRSLGLPARLFDERFNQCYCPDCADPTVRAEVTGLYEPDVKLPPEFITEHANGETVPLPFVRGPTLRSRPVGWCRFGLAVDQKQPLDDVFSRWFVGFHGFTFTYNSRADVAQRLSSILSSGLLKQGDYTSDAKRIGNERGGLPDAFYDAVFASPSLLYSSDYVYTGTIESGLGDCTPGVQFVLQLRLKPYTFGVGGNTLAHGNPPVRRHFSDPDVDPDGKACEWRFVARGAHVITGLLVRQLDPPDL
jgi:hypothetical protein